MPAASETDPALERRLAKGLLTSVLVAVKREAMRRSYSWTSF